MGKTMKALSVRQPWASLIIAGIKDIENRSWLPPQTVMGQDLLICAGAKAAHPEDLVYERDFCAQLGVPFPTDTDLVGVALGIVRVVGYVESDPDDPDTIGYDVVEGVQLDDPLDISWLNDGSIGWILRKPRRIAPFPVKGKLGIFEVSLPDPA